MSSMSPHSSVWPGQKPFLFLCHLLELLCCPLLCVIPAVPVLANSHQAGAVPQGEMNIPIITGKPAGALLGLQEQIPRSWEVPAPSSQVSFTARACLWGVKGINGSHKIFQVACHHLSCALCKWKQGACYLPASVSLCWLMKISPKQTLGASEKCIHVVLENLPHLLTKIEI